MSRRRRRAPAPANTPPWADLAYRLWRKRWEWWRIVDLLREEGWDVGGPEVAATVLERAGRELNA